MTVSSALKIVAWMLLVGIAFVTVAPIEFRPITPLPVQIERSGALALVGFVFALAYPRRIVLVTVLVLGATALLEAAQVLEPSRHGRFLDLLVKLVGGGFGLACGYLLNRIRRRD